MTCGQAIAQPNESSGLQTIYTPDALDRITQLTDAINGVTQFGYDANSNLLTVTDAKSQQTAYTYSNMNRTSTSAELTAIPF